ncbi:MAG: protein kinase [Polyangiaceae bacterium]
MSAQAPERVGRYLLHGEIASGGMARVYLASLEGSAGFARRVAVKRLHGHLAAEPEWVAMFIDEARLAGRIHHPNVVATLDAISEAGELMLVMEYVHGETLARLQRAGGWHKVPPHIACAIMVGVLRGLHAAHETRDETGRLLRLVHRDVSPQNVLVGVDGVPRLSDFGVAKAEARLQSTQDGQLKGKLGYMSPEQILGKDVDRRSDIFAASVVLWEMLAGRRLFTGEASGGVLMAAVSAAVHPPSAFNSEVTPALDAVVLQGLSKIVEQRFDTAEAMAQALSEVQSTAEVDEVGRWVEERAANTLRTREQLLSAMSARRAGTEVTSPAVTVVPHSASAGRAKRRWVPAVALVGGVAVLAVPAVGWIGSGNDAPPRLGRVAVSVMVPTLDVAGLTSATAAHASDKLPVDGATPTPKAPSVAAAPRAVTPRTTAPRPAPKAKPKDGCNPPYEVLSDGVRRWKARCL